MDQYFSRASDILTRISILADLSEEKHCLTRTFGTPAFFSGCLQLLSWMHDAGLNARLDNIGNVRGKWHSANPNARTLVIASHIDTVRNAGKFDGPLGVLLGLELITHLKQTGLQLPFHIELVAFSDEEGTRFHTTYLGSTVLAGTFDQTLLSRTDADGCTLQEVITGLGGDTSRLFADSIPANEWLGYFEAHIEQGPVLYENNLPVAVVQGIAGQLRARLTFTGEPGHAGTVPMYMRRDALCAAAACALSVEAYASAHQAQIVATIGTIQIPNAASNVIPGQVTCSLDLRSPNAHILDNAHTALKEMCALICAQRDITLGWEVVQQTSPVACHAGMNNLLASAIEQAGYQPIQLVSGAGHDAVPISSVAPVSMLFIRCYKGISHHPEENVEAADIAVALKVSEQFIHRLMEVHKV
jgi:allantoate deiminase